VNMLGDFKKMLHIFLLYSRPCNGFYSSCIIKISGDYFHVSVLFENMTLIIIYSLMIYSVIDIDDIFYSQCRNPLYQIMLCNMCPVCTK